jgi:exodeoxyribonuclease V beta subunit
VGSEPEEVVVADEELGDGAGIVDPSASDGDLRGVPLLLAGMPGGLHVGTLIHRVLEVTDFTAADLVEELRAGIDTARAGRQLDLGDLDIAVEGLKAMIETPLGSLTGEMGLRDIGRGDRLDELGFELPLVGGDSPQGDLSVSDIAALLDSHLPAGDLLAPYAKRLADPGLDRTLRGYLTGSLDLVLRLPGQRYVIVDYKTNWLGTGDDPLTAWHYRPAALHAEMQHAHYPLQALLYTVALHRYLRWRLSGYDPSQNLAGVLYLFVRGMSSPDFPRVDGQPCGVWSWQTPAPLVEALSDLFDIGRTAA